MLRRLDCVLAPTKDRILKRQAELRGKGLQDLDAQLRKASGFAFYNTSRYDFDKLFAEAPHLAANLRNYIAGFSPNMRKYWKSSILITPSANSMRRVFFSRCSNAALDDKSPV